MKKSLIAAAIATAVAAPVANAEVIIYGKVHASIDYIDVSGFEDDEHDHTTTVTALAVDDSHDHSSGAGKGWYVSSRASRLGFKGTEDLGDGLSLIWKYETGVDIADSPSSGGIFKGTRNSYIGLAGDWGTFLYGRHDTPMKMSTGRLDLFSDQLGDYNFSAGPNNALLGPGFQDIRADNAIAYISPNWNGFTAAAAIVPGENSEYDDGTNNGLADTYSIAGMYSNNGLYLAAAYENLAAMKEAELDIGKISPSLTPLGNKIIHWDEPLKKWRIGGGYTMNAFTLNFVYENQKSDDVFASKGFPVSNYEADIWQVSGAYDFGNNRVKLAYGENKGSLTNTDVGPGNGGGNGPGPGALKDADGKSKHWAIGLDHKLSKRTTAYAVYAEAKVDDIDESHAGDGDGRYFNGGKENGFSMGMIHTF